MRIRRKKKKRKYFEIVLRSGGQSGLLSAVAYNFSKMQSAHLIILSLTKIKVFSSFQSAPSESQFSIFHSTHIWAKMRIVHIFVPQ